MARPFQGAPCKKGLLFLRKKRPCHLFVGWLLKGRLKDSGVPSPSHSDLRARGTSARPRPRPGARRPRAIGPAASCCRSGRRRRGPGASRRDFPGGGSSAFFGATTGSLKKLTDAWRFLAPVVFEARCHKICVSGRFRGLLGQIKGVMSRGTC